jgi:hypothetical protein
MKFFISEIAENRLIVLAEYLLTNWGFKVKKEFLAKLV